MFFGRPKCPRCGGENLFIVELSPKVPEDFIEEVIPMKRCPRMSYNFFDIIKIADLSKR